MKKKELKKALPDMFDGELVSLIKLYDDTKQLDRKELVVKEQESRREDK